MRKRGLLEIHFWAIHVSQRNTGFSQTVLESLEICCAGHVRKLAFGLASFSSCSAVILKEFPQASTTGNFCTSSSHSESEMCPRQPVHVAPKSLFSFYQGAVCRCALRKTRQSWQKKMVTPFVCGLHVNSFFFHVKACGFAYV